MWDVDKTKEYEEWFKDLDEDSKEALLERVLLLEELGPNLPRPYADTLKGSKYSNLKELRAKTEKHVLRVAFCFDPERKGWLLLGGDKKGKDQKKFYKNLIAESESIIKKYKIL